MNRRSALSKLLKEYSPTTPQEMDYRAEMLELCSASADPFHRNNFDPGHFTASAFVLSPDDTDILLILHGKLHRWLQPGGHVDPTDLNIMEAARREVLEETGLTHVDAIGGILDIDVHVIPARKGDPDHKHFDVRMLFRSQSRDFSAGSDAQAGQWVKLEKVDNIESDASVSRAVHKLLAMRTGGDLKT